MLRYRYRYIGPVMLFDRLICPKWTGETVAASENIARSHLAYQFKMSNGQQVNARITFPGKLEELEAIM